MDNNKLFYVGSSRARFELSILDEKYADLIPEEIILTIPADKDYLTKPELYRQEEQPTINTFKSIGM